MVSAVVVAALCRQMNILGRDAVVHPGVEIIDSSRVLGSPFVFFFSTMFLLCCKGLNTVILMATLCSTMLCLVYSLLGVFAMIISVVQQPSVPSFSLEMVRVEYLACEWPRMSIFEGKEHVSMQARLTLLRSPQHQVLFCFVLPQVHLVENVQRRDERYWLPGQPEEAYVCIRVRPSRKQLRCTAQG